MILWREVSRMSPELRPKHRPLERLSGGYGLRDIDPQDAMRGGSPQGNPCYSRPLVVVVQCHVAYPVLSSPAALYQPA